VGGGGGGREMYAELYLQGPERLRCRRRLSRTKFYLILFYLTKALGSQNCVAPDD